MKVRIYFLTLFLAIGSIGPALSQAPGSEQPGDQPPPPPQDGSRPPRERKGPAFLEKLPPDVRKRFEDAREKALQDPKIKALREKSDKANREFFDAMRAKMKEIDPGLVEIIKENAPNWKGGRELKEGKEERQKPPGQGGPGLGNLTEAERQQLLSAREKAKEDPAVVEARKQREAATTPEERQAAGQNYRKVMNEALLKIDPSLGPILEKVGPPAGGPPPPPNAGGEEMSGPPQ